MQSNIIVRGLLKIAFVVRPQSYKHILLSKVVIGLLSYTLSPPYLVSAKKLSNFTKWIIWDEIFTFWRWSDAWCL